MPGQPGRRCLAAARPGFQILDQGTLFEATARLDEDVAGYPRGAVVRVTPSVEITASSNIEVVVAGGALVDAWSNANGPEQVRVTYRPGVAYTGPALGSTSTQPVERSLVGNELLFQSHLYDYDADLLHMRARVLDPNTGLFLQRDPAGYEDSVNLYAGFGHDAVNRRDPSGPLSGNDSPSTDRFLASRPPTWMGLAVTGYVATLGAGGFIFAAGGTMGWFGGLSAARGLSGGIGSASVGVLSLVAGYPEAADRAAIPLAYASGAARLSVAQ